MFVDKKSECLIRYLAENEPTKVDGKYIYPVSQLVSSFDSDQNHWSAEYLKPYLVTLQEQELVTSFDFPNRYSVHIEPTARLLHFDEYQSAEQPADDDDCPHTEVVRPNHSWFGKVKSVFEFLDSLGGVIVSVVTIAGMLFACSVS
jgi:hypothetical protein